MMTRSIARRLATALTAVLFTAALPATALDAQGAARDGVVRGTLFIVGGGQQPRELVQQFVDLAGGAGHARIAVFPMASGDSTAGPEKATELRSYGADAFVLDVSRTQANTDSITKLVSGATGIWFVGGDQARLTAALLGTAALRAMHDRYRAGAVVGGTSAGAAVMSDSMLTGNQFFPGMAAAVDSGVSSRRIGRHVIEITPGLGFLHDAIVDQHFIRRQRENRLLSVIMERPSFVGVGIDEGTALRVNPDGRWQVLGASAAIVIDARHSPVTSATAPRLGAVDMHVSVLPAGSTYDPRSGRATLPGG